VRSITISSARAAMVTPSFAAINERIENCCTLRPVGDRCRS
jgi:hypothetical protein